MSALNECKNCGNEINSQQKFCPNCGQKTDTHHINFHFLIHELQHGIFHVDKGILFTIKELFVRPGHSIREYINGKRKSHFPPVTLIMILGAIASLLNKFLNDSFIKDDFEIQQAEITPENEQVISRVKFLVENFKSVSEWINHHFAVFLLLTIPFFALGIYWAFKKFKRYNYAESLVISTFLVGQSLVIYIVTLPLKKLNENLDIISLYLMIGMFIFTFIQIFNDKKKWEILLRSFYSLFLVWLQLVVICIFLGFYIMYKFKLFF
jgi:ribosomal protein L32